MPKQDKKCFDFLNSKSFVGWNVSNILNNVQEVGSSFLSCTFNWVRREVNGVAHALAKFASPLRSSLCCTSSSIPRSVWIGWNHDVSLLSF